MSRHRKPVATSAAACCVAVAVAFVLAPLACPAETVASHCSAKEQTLFNCSTGSKTVSVCDARSRLLHCSRMPLDRGSAVGAAERHRRQPPCVSCGRPDG